MSTSGTQRRLAAILAADVVGYSRLMGQDEAGTLAALKALRAELLDPKIADHSGRVFKTTGDGLLAEFPSVVNAVACAIEIQRGIKHRNVNVPDEKAIQLRVGINLGDIIVEDGDVFGDGVNVATRLEGIAPPGGLAVAGTVRDHLGTRLKLRFEDIGEQRLKNIDRPVHVYLVRDGLTKRTSNPELPDKPSIAVLPFDNLSGDPEQGYLADGIVEEIITALSRFRQLFVIARNSSFTYKGRAVDVKQVGRELGVRYVLEGSVRKAGSRVRITGQLIDATTGAHLWADRFDGSVEDIFDLQDQVTANVIGAIAPKLEQAEIERARQKPTDSLDAYDCFLRGSAAVHTVTKEGNQEAIRYFKRAINLDPNFASAYGMAARCYSQRKVCGWETDRSAERSETERLARRAAQIGKDDALALCTAAMGLAYVVGHVDDAEAWISRALTLNPNLAWAWLFGGWIKTWLGEPEVGIARFAHAMRLSPQDSQFFNMQAGTASAHFVAGRYDDAVSWASASVLDQPNYVLSHCVLAAAAALSGRLDQAQKAVIRLRELDPELRIANVGYLAPLKRQEDLERLEDGLRRAGVPQ